MSGTIVPMGSPEKRLRALRQAAEEDGLELLAAAVKELGEAIAARNYEETAESALEIAEMALVGLSPRYRDAPSPN